LEVGNLKIQEKRSLVVGMAAATEIATYDCEMGAELPKKVLAI